MAQYIDKSAVQAEIERRINERDSQMKRGKWFSSSYVYEDLLDFLDTLVVKEVDLEIFGAIARHVIAVKEHVEDMRFDEEEWLTLEKIGYPERFESQKGEQDDLR